MLQLPTTSRLAFRVFTAQVWLGAGAEAESPVIILCLDAEVIRVALNGDPLIDSNSYASLVHVRIFC